MKIMRRYLPIKVSELFVFYIYLVAPFRVNRYNLSQRDSKASEFRDAARKVMPERLSTVLAPELQRLVSITVSV